MTSHPFVMRPIEEKHVSVKIELMVWSTKMDLLALSYANGDVVLHRLSWLKVWVLPPPRDDVVVKAIAWRPDGKVLAIAYSNKEILLVSVEKKKILNISKEDVDITCMRWSEGREEESTAPSVIQSNSQLTLPPLPNLTRRPGDEYVQTSKDIDEQKELNFLLIGLSTGKLLIKVFGLYPRVVVDLLPMLRIASCNILDIGASRNHDILLVTLMTGNSVWVVSLESRLLFAHDKVLITLASKYSDISSCLDYIDITLQNIIEGWENIMLEMDSKLRKYAEKVAPGQISCDFLELLMFGTASEEMAEFLLDDLTEKGLKKLNHAVELSYVNIQGLVLKHLLAAGQCLSTQLDELLGFSRCPTYFEVMGFLESDVVSAFSAVGSFLIKVAEVQHVIDESLKKYKAFFRWLYATFLRLCDERVTSEVSNMSQLELQQIVDFLSALEGEGGFNLEQLAQYLADAPLEMAPPPSEAWAKILEKHPSLASLPYIVPHNTQLSLVQEVRQLIDQVLGVFKRSEKHIEGHFILKQVSFVTISEGIGDGILPKVTHSYTEEQHKFTVAMVDPLRSNGYYFWDVWASQDTPIINFIDTPQKIVDVQFYLHDILSLLLDLSPEAETGFAQVPYGMVGEPLSIRTIQGMVPAKFSVCGTRKVAVVLSDSRRKVKIFEMDVEEEDDDEGMDTTNSSMRENDLDISGRS